MTTQHSNPFVLPGFGQSGALAGNPIMASLEMMRQAWQSLAEQGGFGVPSVAATLSAEDLERRITDLRAVENWLRMNLTVLSSTIQGMEVQRATISTLKNFVSSAAQDASALESLFGVKPAQSAQSATAAQESSAEPPPAADAAAPLFDSEQAVAATQAWWEMLRKQFDTLAAATAASMQPDVAGMGAQAAAPRKAASAKAQASAAAGKASPRAPTKPASGKPRATAKPAAGSRRRAG